MPSSIKMRIHGAGDRGDRRLDGILRLIEEAGRARPIADVLATLCVEIAAIARAEVVSVYVRQGDELVMLGNVGFSPDVVGKIRLQSGEGITGFVAECLRPVSCAVARDQIRYKHVPGLGEEHFPSFLALPLLGTGGASGVLVLQRREAREWAPAEVALAMALAAPVSYAIERARDRYAERTSTAGFASRSARLDGVAVAGGAAIGRAESAPAIEDAAAALAGDEAGRAVAAAFAQVGRELDRARRRLERRLDGDGVRRLRMLALVLDDRRLIDLAVAECARSGVARGLARVVRELARAPYRGAADGDGNEWLAERADEVADLCALVAARAAGKRVLHAGAVVVAERLTAVLALACAAHRCAGLALGGPVTTGDAKRRDPSDPACGRDAQGGLGTALARAAGLPVVADLASLFVWARPGDRVLVDGDNGHVRINPPATAVARLRAQRRA